MTLAEAKFAGIYPPSKMQKYKENKGINYKVLHFTSFYFLVAIALSDNWGIWFCTADIR